MQQKLVSFLIAGSLLAVTGTALDLPLGGLGGAANARPPRTLQSNVATLTLNAPNIAYLDPDFEPIEIIQVIPGVPEHIEREWFERRMASAAIEPPAAPTMAIPEITPAQAAILEEALAENRPTPQRRVRPPEPVIEEPAPEEIEVALAPPTPAPIFPIAGMFQPEPITEEPLSPPTPIDDNPFGIMVSETRPERRFSGAHNTIEFSSPEFAQAIHQGAEAHASAPRRDIDFDARRVRSQQPGAANPNPFAQTLGSARPTPEPAPRPTPLPQAAATMPERDLSQLAPRELRREFERTFISENQFLSPMETPHMPSMGARTPNREILELQSGPMMVGGREVLQMRLEFSPDSAAVSSESVNIIRSFSQVATASPTNAIEVAISDRVMEDEELRRLAARRFAIISNIMRGAGVAERQILPVLSTRDTDSIIFSIIDTEIYTHVLAGQRDNMFGDEIRGSRTFELRRW